MKVLKVTPLLRSRDNYKINMERLIDYIFFLYFASHIPISLMFDSQTVVPRWIFPKPVRILTFLCAFSQLKVAYQYSL